ncbi:GBS Bsp-like repeat-containing protein [[Clostridium] scindens]|uniref:GBS Bsp-like repeat-containing protein n=1 Tax=Clostridium scindens (strain JCM 10418 / VPI 12708) TaxID=29347 RepID=UPI0002E76ECF|nr:GBS Bsp-like repeat-containing protein [[Clostridium] scindens]
MGRKLKNRLAYILIIVMLCSTMSLENVNASDYDSLNSTEGNNESNTIIENQQEADNEQTDNSSVQQKVENEQYNASNEEADNVTEEIPEQDSQNIEIQTNDETQVLINYVSVDKPFLETPNEQNVVVSFGNGNENISKVRLVCKKNDGSDLELNLTRQEKELYLFTIPLEKKDSGTYELDSFAYFINGIEQIIDLKAIGIEAKFGVNEFYPGYENGDINSNDIDVSVVDVDANKVIAAQTDIEEALDATQEAIAESSGESVNDKSRNLKTSRTAVKEKVVVLDPGHGGSDGGAAANGLVEKNLTLKIAQYCKQELEEYSGLKVYMTRNNDSDVGLSERVQMAKRWGADVFVSIHINSASAGANGVEVWYPNSSYNANIHAQGKDLANEILKELVGLGLTNRGIKIRNSENGTKYPDGSLADYYSVIKDSKTNGFPGIIVEHAFISNPSDAAKLKQESFLKQLGIADAIGIANYFGLSKNPEIRIVNKNDFSGTFKVKITGVGSSTNTTKVEVPVWCQTDGQDDLKWYTATLQNDGSYTVDVAISNHNDQVGTYIADLYVTYRNGTMEQLGRTSAVMSKTSANISVEKNGTNPAQYQSKVVFSNMPTGVKSVQFAVWSNEGGQNDLKWYMGKDVGNDTWLATIDLNNHKTYGNYSVHAYLEMEDGYFFNFGNTSFEVQKANVGELKVKDYNQNEGSFRVIIRLNNTDVGINKVDVPIWCSSNQSDIKWYTAIKQADGTYSVDVNIANHKYNSGEYNIHAYLTDAFGNKSFGQATTFAVIAPKSEVTAKDAAGTETNYELKATNLGLYGDVRKVEFAVWSLKGGQDDLVWYQASRDSSGAYRATVPISRHRTTGEYEGDAYITLSNGTLKYVGTAKFEITIPSLNLYVANYDASLGSFDVILNNIVSPSGINKIEVPVWCSSNQSDIKWYKAVKQNDGTYKITVDPMYHNLHSGIYQIHAYITTGNGIMTLAGTTTQLVKAPELYTIMGTTTTTVDQMMKYYKSSGVNYPGNELGKGGAPTLESFCKLYLEEANAEGVRAEVAFAQTMLETGWLKYGGIVKIEQFNFAGIGALDGNSTGNCATFPDVRTGIRAQIQHLKAYGSSGALTNSCVDPRFHLVKRNCAPYVQWLGQKENPQGNGWATSERYGYNIMSGIQKLKSL